jgi:hypothetical protein
LHGIPQTLVSNRNVCFTSKFWNSLPKFMKISINMSIKFYPNVGCQKKDQSYIFLEKYLYIFVSFNQVDWVECLTTIKFACNISFHTSINVNPF